MDTKVGKIQEFGSDSFVEVDKDILKATVSYLRKEIDKFKGRPLLICEVKKIYKDKNKVVIKVPNGNLFFVDILGGLSDKLNINDQVLVEQRSLTVVDKLEKSSMGDVEHLITVEKPRVKWEDIGGLENQIAQIKEVIELPLKNPEIFKKVGIKPSKGILLYGPSGTGKTLLAKAVAASTEATFIQVIASELNQKFIGEGAKLVKSIFKLARKNAPSIIFIDEIDALAAERLDVGTSGEREVERTLMQLLSEMDGFENLDNVKVIGATNRADILDTALLRPGRFDRLVEVPLPGKEGITEIFRIHTRDMKLDKVSAEILIKKMKDFSGAEVNAACTEAGYSAIRNNRTKINMTDFLDAIKKVKEDEEQEHLNMFG